MKHNLLSVLALIGASLLSGNAWAQWEAPTVPQKPTEAGEFVDGGNYYLRNVDNEQFLAGGNSWATQASFTYCADDPEHDALIVTIATETKTLTAGDFAGLTMKLNGSFTATGTANRTTAYTVSDTYIFRDSEESSFIDYNNQKRGLLWTVTKVGEYYRIQTDPQDAYYPNAATQYFGWDATEGPIEYEDGVLVGGSTVVKCNLTEDNEFAAIDWELIPADDYLNEVANYDTRVELYELLVSTQEAIDGGLAVDQAVLDAAGNTYNNANATLEELNAALTSLKVAVNRATFEAAWADASEDNPLDVTTDCLVNPDFSTGDISGWLCTFVKGTNCTNLGYQSASYDNTGGTCVSGEYGSSISQFIEAWTADGSFNSVVGDGTLEQTVYGLPAGKYVLHCDAIANDQYSGRSPVQGVNLFIQAGQFGATTAVATGNGKPEHFSVTFINDGSDSMTFGLKTESAEANWIAADNFQIFFYGMTTDSPEMAMLKETIKAAQEYDIYVPAYVEIVNAFTVALDAAQALVAAGETDSETLLAANTTLKEATTALKNSQADYASFLEFINKVESLESEVGDQWPELSDILAEWREETLQPAYDEGLYTSEEIAAAKTELNQKIRDFIAEGNVNPGDDLTLLIENADFSEGSGATNIPGWTIKSGAITELSATYHNIEAYHTAFDFSQTIANMPAGVYQVGVQGFIRMDGSDKTMTLYAGSSTNTFKLITDEYALTPIYGNVDDGADSDGQWPYDTKHVGEGPNGEDFYVPNSMEGAKKYFDEVNPITGEPYYQNTVKIVHKGGDLEIGVKCTSTSEWILWDNFTMTYIGEGIEEYYELIEEKAQELEGVYTNGFVTAEGESQYTTVMAKVDDMGNLKTGDEANALIAEIDEVIAYITDGNTRGAELTKKYNTYGETLIDAVESSDEAFPMLLATIADKLENPVLFADNEAVTAEISVLKKGWTKYVLYDGQNATEENPWEAQYVIYNFNYTDPVEGSYGADGWTIDNNVGSGNNWAADYAELECWNDSSINVSQKIEGLYEGFYLVELQGYYRPGSNANLNDSIAALKYAKAFGVSSVGEFGTPLKSVVEGWQAEAIGTGDVEISTGISWINEGHPFYVPNSMEGASTYFASELYPNSFVAEVGADGELTIGVKKDEGYIADDWTIFTNWNIKYMGTTAPTAVETIAGNENANANIAIYNLAGQRVGANYRGIVIVNGKKMLK